MKKKFIALALALALGTTATACSDYRGPDVKVTTTSSSTTVNYHNGYSSGDVNIVPNDDNTYDVIIHVQPGEYTHHAP